MNKCRRTVVQCGLLSQMLPRSPEENRTAKALNQQQKYCTIVRQYIY